MSRVRRLKVSWYVFASVIAIAAFALVGVACLVYCYIFGLGTGLYGAKNAWDSDDTEILISGLALIGLAIANPIRSELLAMIASVVLIMVGSFQGDRMIVSMVLLVVLWMMYVIGARSRRIKAA